MSSTKRESRHFHVVVVQRRQKKVPTDFLPFSLPPPSSLLKLPKDLAYPVGEFAGRGPKFGPATRTEAALIRNLTAFEHFLILSDFGSDVYRIFPSNFSATLHVAGTMWASSLKDFSVSTGNHNPEKKFFFLQNVR